MEMKSLRDDITTSYLMHWFIQHLVESQEGMEISQAFNMQAFEYK